MTAFPSKPTVPDATPDPAPIRPARLPVYGPHLPPLLPTFTRKSIAWSVFLALGFLFTLSGWVPWRVEYPPGTLDPSWIMALKWAHVHHIDFGTGFVFTYGPWGYTLEGYDPATFGQLVAVWSFFSAAFFCGVIVLCRGARLPWWVCAIWIAAVSILLGSNIIQVQDVRMFALSCVFLLVHFFGRDKWASRCKILLLIAMALAGLVKFSMTLMAVGIVGVTTAHQLLEIWIGPKKATTRKTRAWRLAAAAIEPGVFAVAYVILWLIPGQKLASLPLYVSHSMIMSNAYDRAEQGYTDDETKSVLLYFACAVPLIVLIVVALRRRRLPAAFAAAGTAGCVFILFKSGFVRHDMHELEATMGVTLLSLLWGLALWKSIHWIGRTLAVLVVAGSVSLCAWSHAKYDDKSFGAELWRAIADFPARSGTALSWIAGDCNMRKPYENKIKEIQKANERLPFIHGSVDIYPWGQSFLLARDMDYRPRPVIQSYLAYTQKLEELNAEHLRGKLAPDWIFFSFGTIDGRYTSLDDALSWPELLTRYDLADMSSVEPADLLLLKRAIQPRSFKIIPGDEQTAKIGDVIKVPPSDQPIWLRLDVHLSTWGKLKETAYKAMPVAITITTADGKKSSYRILPDMTKAGFLLSPHLLDKFEFAMLYGKQWQLIMPERIVTSIQIQIPDKDNRNTFYDPTIKYSFDRLDYPLQDISAVPGYEPFIGYRYMVGHLDPRMSLQAPLLTVPLSAIHRYALRVFGNSQLIVRAIAPPKSVRVVFGLFDQAISGPIKSDGVQFLVYAVDAHGKGVQIWSHLLDPASQAKDRGPQGADVPLPDGTVAVMLETKPITPSIFNESYWSEVLFQ